MINKINKIRTLLDSMEIQSNAFSEISISHFEEKDFACMCGTCSGLPKNGISPQLIQRLELLRLICNNTYGRLKGIEREVLIVKDGGYRCGPHADMHALNGCDWNRDRGGSKASQHKALNDQQELSAVDITVDGLNAIELFKVTNILFHDGGVGYTKSKDSLTNHVDLRGKRKRWLYKEDNT